MSKPAYYLIVGALLAGSACHKEVETIVVQEVDKVYSWAEAGQLTGTSQYILNMGKDTQALYLQTPFNLGIVRPQGKNGYYAQTGAGLPTDVTLHIPISPLFIAYPQRDTLIEIIRTTEPVTNSLSTTINLRQLDRRITGVMTNTSNAEKPFAAINRNNYLLLSYRTTYGVDPNVHFVLAQLSVQAGGKVQAQARLATALKLNPTESGELRWLVAIDDYFLAGCGDSVYKITQDGTAKRVAGGGTFDTCYKWQGVIYVLQEYNALLLSKDDGETWQRSTGAPDTFTFSTYHVVSDSLIGISSGNIFTLKWKGTDYTIRALKNDGFGQRTITSMEQLGDTVYVGTTGGLFKRPLSKFFESKPK